MRKHWYVIFATCGILAAGIILFIILPELPGAAGTSDEDRIFVGLMPDESSALVYIAKEKALFEKEGLNLTLKTYPNGAAAVRGIETGEVDLTLSSEFPLVGEIAAGQDILIIGTIDKYYGTYLVARTERGIAVPSDLPGKTISFSKGSIGEYYLAQYLERQGIPAGCVTLVNRPPDAVFTDLPGDTGIDAAVATPLTAYRLMNQSPDRYVAFPILGGQATYKVVTGNRTWVTRNPWKVTRFFLALHDASEYAAANPGESQKIVVKNLNISEGYIRSVWPEHQYKLSLDQSLLLAMEGEARWMIRSNITPADAVPDFLTPLNTEYLESVDTTAVRIIGTGEHV